MHSSKINLENFSVKIFSVMIDEKYFNYIENGEKTVEGRIFKGKYKNINTGNIVEFINRGNEEEKIFRKVTKIEIFDNFTAMINAIGVEKLLPNVSSKEDGVDIYRSFGSYEEEEKKFDVVAFILGKVD